MSAVYVCGVCLRCMSRVALFTGFYFDIELITAIGTCICNWNWHL